MIAVNSGVQYGDTTCVLGAVVPHARHDVFIRVVVAIHVHHDVLVVALHLVIVVTLHRDTVVVRLVLAHRENAQVVNQI